MLRGAFSLQGKLHASALELLKVVYPLNTVDLAAAAPHNIASTLAPVFEPQIFAMSANTVFSQAEKGHLGCVRIHVKGTKSIIATPDEVLLAYMTARAPGTHPTFPELWQFFKTMTKEALNNYVDAQGKNKLFGCTASAGDIVYTPPCYAIAERALGGPCLGIKYTVMSKGDDVQLEEPSCQLKRRTHQVSHRDLPVGRRSGNGTTRRSCRGRGRRRHRGRGLEGHRRGRGLEGHRRGRGRGLEGSSGA